MARDRAECPSGTGHGARNDATLQRRLLGPALAYGAACRGWPLRTSRVNRSVGGVAGAEHPLHCSLGPTPWRPALRPAFTRRLGDLVASNVRRGRVALPRVRRTHDRARGRHTPRVHCPPAWHPPSLARSAGRRMTSPDPARHVAPWTPYGQRTPNQAPSARDSGISARHPRTPAPRPCPPCGATLDYSPRLGRDGSRRRRRVPEDRAWDSSLHGRSGTT